MSTETTNTPNAETTTQTSNETAAPSKPITGADVFVSVLKIAGLAFAAYKTASHHRPEQQAAALSASVGATPQRPSMASVDPNILLNMGLQHMRNMNRPMFK